MTKILLETLHQKVNLTAAFCTCLSEGAIFCLDSQKHQTNVPLHVTTENSEITPLLFWETKVDDRMHRTYKDENRTTDWGAMCISMLLALNLTEYTEFETSMKNDGVDFWLSKEGELEFSARLEISGIRSESVTNTIDKRLKIKKEQTKQSDSTNIPAYISIIEFSKPKAIFVRK